LDEITVKVVNADGPSAPNPPNDLFSYDDSALKPKTASVVGAPPAVVSLDTNHGPTGGNTAVRITGQNFSSASTVKFGTVPGGVFAFAGTAASGTLSGTSPAQSAGVVDVLVTDAGQTSQPTPFDQFTYADVPNVTGVSPPGGSKLGGTAVSINGTGFASVTRVTFGGITASFTVTPPSLINAISPANPGTGTVDVRVTNCTGTSPANTTDKFTYT
jgi:hypothetical protein